MEGNTHIAVGIASSLIILQPNSNIKELFLGTSLAVVGSLVSDIDTRKSKANKTINKLGWFIGFFSITSLILDYIFEFGIYERVLNDIFIMRIIVAISLFSVLIMFTKITNHRTFSHSIVGVISFYVPVFILFDKISNYFLIAIISHIFIDLFNKKKIQLFYPNKKGFSFKLCTSNGLTNKILFYLSIVCIIYVCVKFISIFSVKASL